jgi:hypothetical protein
VKVDEWQQWYNGNIAVFGDLRGSNIRLEQENSESNSENSKLRNKLRLAEPVEVFIGLLGLGAGIGTIFPLGKWLLRASRSLLTLSPEKKKLLLLIGGAAWISVVVLIVSQQQILYLHPVNLLAAVVVYSIPAILFDGIALWWLGSTKRI